MWKATIKIVDNVNNVEKDIEYKFNKITTYSNLFNDLPNLYSVECKCVVDMYFIYLEKRELVKDLYKYILNRDVIEIVLKKQIPTYMLCDVINGERIKTSTNIKELYKVYNDRLHKTMDCELLLVKQEDDKLTLIDVLDSPKRLYNECLNRLIHKYNF
jgi:hypothetical protein